MSFLAPIGLATLFLAPIIIAIHLWLVRYRRYDLSSTLLWSRVLSETPLRRPRRLPTRLLLLALQLAALACGALALARPAWVAAGLHRHLVVAVDTSLAMSATDGAAGRTRLGQAVGEVGTMVDRMAPGDTLTLVDAGTTPRVLGTSDQQSALRHMLSTLRQGYGPSSLAADAPLLGGLSTGTGRGTTYLFVPAGTAIGTIGALRAAARPLQLRLLGAHPDDRAVAGFTVACDAGRCEAFARLINTATQPVTIRVAVAVNDGRGAPQQGSRDVTLPADSVSPIGLPLAAGAQTVELHVAGHDALPADDTAWAIVPAPVHRRVLLVTNDPTSALAQALHAIPNVTVTTAPDDGSYNDGMTRQADLTVLDNTGNDVQPPGNVLVVNPASGAGLFALGPGVGEPGITALQAHDPLLRGVDLSSLVISSATRVRLPAWAHVDIDGDGVPLLFSGVTGGRRVAVLTFDPRAGAATNASNLSSLLAFPTLLQNAVETLAPAPAVAVPAGDPAPLDVARQDAPVLQLQAAHAQPLPSSGDLAALPALRPGVYSYSGAAGGTGRLAANPVPPQDPSTPQNLTAPPAAPSAPAVIAPTFLTPLEGWALLALLALFALGGEWWYYVRRT